MVIMVCVAWAAVRPCSLVLGLGQLWDWEMVMGMEELMIGSDCNQFIMSRVKVRRVLVIVSKWELVNTLSVQSVFNP